VKKSIAMIVMMIYGLLSVGIQLHLHYCCGKLSDVAFFHSYDGCADEDCGSCNLGKKCCQFEDVSFKIDDSHSSSHFALSLPKPGLPSYQLNFSLPQHKETSVSFFAKNKKEARRKVPIFISQQALIYYA